MIDVKEANVLYLDGKFERAADLYLAGAKEGDAECALNYGTCLYLGEGRERDVSEARSFFLFASERYPEAKYNLAVMYLEGIGADKDYRLALEYMEAAADGGMIEAMLYLGVARTMGTLFIPDVCLISRIPYHRPITREAFPLIEGECTEGELDREGRYPTVMTDLSDAFHYFKSAAHHPTDYVEDMALKAKYLYARCYLDGVGVDFNRDTANRLMLAAASEGSKEALFYLETDAPYVLSSLSKDKLDEIRFKFERLGSTENG